MVISLLVVLLAIFKLPLVIGNVMSSSVITTVPVVIFEAPKYNSAPAILLVRSAVPEVFLILIWVTLVATPSEVPLSCSRKLNTGVAVALLVDVELTHPAPTATLGVVAMDVTSLNAQVIFHSFNLGEDVP